MFIREKQTKNKKIGNVYTKRVQVESYHTADGPRQRTIMQLGKLDLPKKYWPVITKELERLLAADSSQEQLSFIPENKIKAVLEHENTVRGLVDKAVNDFHALKRRSTTGFPETQIQSQP